MTREQIPHMLENTPEEFQRVRDLASPSPTPVEAEGTDELRDALMEHFASVLSLYVGDQLPDAVADLLAVPPVVSLLAKLRAVEALAVEWEVKAEGHADAVARYVDRNAAASLRRALDVDRG